MMVFFVLYGGEGERTAAENDGIENGGSVLITFILQLLHES